MISYRGFIIVVSLFQFPFIFLELFSMESMLIMVLFVSK